MIESKPVSTPMDTSGASRSGEAEEKEEMVDKTKYLAIVGSLLYLATRTRPDISYAVGKVAQHSSSPTLTDWKQAKRILRYLKGTTDIGLRFKGDGNQCLGYADADWGGDVVDRKSTSGYVFIHSGAAVS